jgi:hypothetical protein
MARRLMVAIIFIWLLHGIPYIVFLNQIQSFPTGKVICTTINAIVLQYRIYFAVPVLTSILPVIITVFFGFMVYRNVQQLTYRALPLVRRELDTQLTAMVLVQVVFNFFSSLSFTIMNILTTNGNITDDPIILAKIQLIADGTLQIYYANFAVCVN